MAALCPVHRFTSCASRRGAGKCEAPLGKLPLQQLAGFGHAGRGAAVFAGGDAGEGAELAPAEGGARGGEFLGDGAEEFFGVQRAVLADGVAAEQVEDFARVVAELAVALHEAGGAVLRSMRHSI